MEGTPATPNTGMVSLQEINNQLGVENFTQPTTPQEEMQINEMAHDPRVRQMAYASKKTPQQMAQDLLKEMQAQAQKDWEMKQKQLEMQKDQFVQSSDKSKEDANKSYLETVDKLNENRYQQQQDLSISGANRGIQYSPQQLGLENTANINHNKNLAEASNKRNELLNNLDIELGKALANINLGLQGATNEYNQAMASLKADYMKQMMDWTYNDQQKEEERKWQEEQTKKDQEFQKHMQELQNKWQAEQNALDRKKGRSGGGYSGYSYGGGGGRSYSFTPYSGYDWKGYDRSGYGRSTYGYDDLDLSTKEGAEAHLATAKEYMTDRYNSLDYGGIEDQDARAKVYTDDFKKIINQTRKMKNSKKVVKELNKTYDTGVKHLRNKTYARDTNTPYKIGNTVHKPSTPLRKEYIKKKKSTKQLDNANYYSKFARTKKQRKQAKVNASFHKHAGQGLTKGDLKKFNASQKKKKPVTKKPVRKAPSTQSKFQKSFSNLKKNIKKLFGWR